MSSLDINKTEKEGLVRQIKHEDLKEVAALSYRCFGSGMSLNHEQIESQVNIFPRGQVCIEYDGKIVGCALSLIINYDDYGEDHTYDEISGDGYIHNHNPNGANLYGIEVGVDPNYRKMNFGKKLYEERRRICKEHNLKSIIIGGRMPNYHQYATQMSAEDYANAVMRDEIFDPVLTFQKQNGFSLKNVIPNYLPDDEESLYYAACLEWVNSDYVVK
ncbi:GNAT family N-acetyltransferase [Pseudogracilibacillus sp. SO30301A]|uniref:GNAT family N-acetyltransferase n=1 Tax=Pseudogracilibacillus sp. SO30301A TaxID=3098291 RepID=UPI00300E38CD